MEHLIIKFFSSKAWLLSYMINVNYHSFLSSDQHVLNLRVPQLNDKVNNMTKK